VASSKYRGLALTSSLFIEGEGPESHIRMGSSEVEEIKNAEFSGKSLNTICMAYMYMYLPHSYHN
jgi:hypothetical protein